jgi:hypothetical protein
MELSLLGYKINLELLILMGVLYLIIVVHTLYGCCNIGRIIETMSNIKEGFARASTNNGESSLYSLNNYSGVDTSKWGLPDLSYTKGKPQSKAVKQFFNRPSQQIPLPEGELDMFANTQFKPECCPNTFSTSSGCACMTGQQLNYLNDRGGNNVPYSEY